MECTVIIGIDLDNTIITYDLVFYNYAVKKNFIPFNLPVDKKSIRDSIRLSHGDEVWIELQGIIYGTKMSEADFAEGFLDFFQFTSNKSIEIRIVSHKSRFSASRDTYDLHTAVRVWFEQNADIFQNHSCFKIDKDIYLEPTLVSKVQRIQELSCDYFIDDLEEVLTDKHFPRRTQRIHYSPRNSYFQDTLQEQNKNNDILQISHWKHIQKFFEKKIECLHVNK